jgi:pilus assembly protein CpaB
MRRAIGIVGAIAVAALGAILLIGYVRGAEDRALAGEELANVLVVDRPVAKGTPAANLASSVRTERVPVKVLADGGIEDLSILGDLVTSTDLVPGEQLVTSRFIAAQELQTTRIEAPADLLEVTISISPERALGGQLQPGDLVAVIASFDPFDLNTLEPADLAPGQTIDPSQIFVGTTGTDQSSTMRKSPVSTHLILHKVLVTSVQLEQLPRTDTTNLPEGTPALAPTGNLLITLAASTKDVERIVFTAEHGFLWLAAEGENAPEPVTPIQSRTTVYQ